MFAGGIRDEITIALFFCTLPHDPSGEGCHENRYVYITLMPPGRKNRIVSCSPEGFVTQPFDALPGTVVNVASLHEGFWRINVPALVVEWVSTDVAGVSARQVDGGDLAALSQELGYPVRWGFPTETLPYPNAPSTNFRVNFALFGELGVGGTADHIDSQDVAAFAADFSTSCGSSKSQADGSSELQDLMAWFGFVATGRVVAIDPETVAPEYDLHDWIQNRRAILDPYGYRRTEAGTAAVRATWSVVKRVYR